MEVDPSNIFITTIILRKSSDIYDDFKLKNPFGNHELYKHSSAHDWLSWSPCIAAGVNYI